VSVAGIEDVEQRMQIAKIAEAFDLDPEGFAKEWQQEQVDMKQKISRARQLLSQVSMSDDLLRLIASTCIDLGVKTHRAEIVITRTAKTIAAFDGRTEVNQEDVKKAMELALAHRMRSRPFEPPTLNKERLEKSMSQKQHEHQHQDQKPEQQKKNEQQPQEPSEQKDTDQKQAAKPQERIFEIGTPIDVRAITMPRKRDRIARRKTSGRRMNTLALRNRGRYLRQKMPQEGKDIAIDATIRAAAPYQWVRSGPNAIIVKDEDIREKERVGKTSAVVLFVVDASGSMGANQRMESAKGAVLSLLMDSYQKRDKIGMIAFKGKEAEIILPPCTSVDLALGRLRELPTGGKTPLSAGLSRGLQLLQGELRKDEESKLMMVLISDGMANEGMGGKIKDELMAISERIKHLGIHTIVIDSEVVDSSFLDMRLGYCHQIADQCQGKYYPLSSLTPESLLRIVDEEQKLLFDDAAINEYAAT
jgi:magnesium chelatase subunit D